MDKYKVGDIYLWKHPSYGDILVSIIKIQTNVYWLRTISKPYKYWSGIEFKYIDRDLKPVNPRIAKILYTLK